jgi:hypothetical protein
MLYVGCISVARHFVVLPVVLHTEFYAEFHAEFHAVPHAVPPVGSRELQAVRTHRAAHRARRSAAPIPVVALVGYTNAGEAPGGGVTEGSLMGMVVVSTGAVVINAVVRETDRQAVCQECEFKCHLTSAVNQPESGSVNQLVCQ